MNCDKIKEHMIQSGEEARFVDALDPAIRKLAESDMDPYMAAIALIDLSAKIVLTSLPNEEFAFYGKYLGKVSDRIERCVVAKEDAIRSITGSVDGWDLRNLD